MQFRGTTAEECRQWQAQFAAKLRSLLGPYAPPERWKTIVQETVDLPDHRRELARQPLGPRFARTP
jgi:hypothetical protein